MIDNLDRYYDEIWLVDFEFSTGESQAEVPRPICMVAIEYFSGRAVRVWLWGVENPPCPITFTDRTLYVAYNASADIRCHLVLNWPIPTRVLDLYFEFRLASNSDISLRNHMVKTEKKGRFGLLNCLRMHSLEHLAITNEAKECARALCIRGGPFVEDERKLILEYCETDVVALQRLLPMMVPKLELKYALLRGRYARAVARMEHVGTPVNLDLALRLRQHWPLVVERLIARKKENFDVLGVRDIDQNKFSTWIHKHGLEAKWPRTQHGFASNKNDLSDLAKTEPVVQELKEYLHTVRQSRLVDTLRFSSDGYNRTMLSPFASITGRNQPSTSEFIFGPACWIRSLIQPPPGSALIYLDWSGQEYGIAAYNSGDSLMQEDYASGDPYLAFAKRVGRAPQDATKATHPILRSQMKIALGIGVLYGAKEDTIARTTGMTLYDAKQALKAHQRVYKTFWKWRQNVIDTARLTGILSTPFGWRWAVSDDDSTNRVSNWVMQSFGAEMMRIATCLTTENGIKTCAPVHDALLVMCPESESQQTMDTTIELMTQASAAVLGGHRLRVSAESIVRHPESYSDPRGQSTFADICDILYEIEAEDQT